MSYSNARMSNHKFSNLLEDSGLTKEAQSKASSYLRDRIREDSFTDKIISAENITPNDCQVSENHDGLVKFREVEPESRAMPISFRGTPTAKYINGRRYPISFFTISTLRLEITEQELMAYDMPIAKIMERHSFKDMLEVKDKVMIGHFEAAVNAMQNLLNSTTSFTSSGVRANTQKVISKIKSEKALENQQDNFIIYAVQRRDIIKLKKLLAQVITKDGEILRAGRLRPVAMLITDPDATEIEAWTAETVGDTVVGKISIQGFDYSTVGGLRMIRTIKTDILREGNIYVFTAKEFLGDNYVLNDVKVYIDKEANKIRWQAWMDIGLGIGNIASVIKMELYSGDAALTNGDADNVRPLDYSQLGSLNNKIEDGLYVPAINQY